MKRRVMVRYKVKADRVPEHEKLIADVFAELEQAAPDGIRYCVFKQTDGVSFVHVAFIDVETNPLDSIGAFRAFGANIKDRCEEPPASLPYSDIGSYRF